MKISTLNHYKQLIETLKELGYVNNQTFEYESRWFQWFEMATKHPKEITIIIKVEESDKI